MTQAQRSQSVAAVTLRWIGALGAGVAMMIIIAWLTGRVASDRWWWSQWLLWIPTPVAMVASGLGLVAALRPPPRRASPAAARRRRLLFWLVIAAPIVAYFLLIEHRFVRWGRGESSASLSIVCWNLDHNYSGHVPQLLDKLVELDGDITIAIGGGGVPVQPEVYEGLRASQLPVVIGPFTVISRATIIEYRHLVASDGIAAAIVRFDCTDSLKRELTVLLVNLPSDPRRGRWQSAEKLMSMLDAASAPEPDLVAGDFNMTRGSRALRHLFPQLTHAFDAAGRGYGASFPRELPLYHIDHVLLGEPVDASTYELIDTNHSRHLAQRVRIVAAAASR